MAGGGLTITPTSAITQTFNVYCEGVGAYSSYTGPQLSTVPFAFVASAPVFADTTISTSTQFSKTEFSTPLFTTTPSGLDVTYEISSVSGSVAAPSGLNAVDITDGSNIKITPTDASSSGWMMHQFYIRATITGTTTVHESS